MSVKNRWISLSQSAGSGIKCQNENASDEFFPSAWRGEYNCILIICFSQLFILFRDIVLQCLDDKDESIRLRALDLIVGMVRS